MSQGQLVREGKLADLIAVESQTEVTLENASPELLAKLRALVESEGGKTRLLKLGHPHTTLERLFLEATEGRLND
jgi:ABC-2 type transport system ATP-binding protein